MAMRVYRSWAAVVLLACAMLAHWAAAQTPPQTQTQAPLQGARARVHVVPITGMIDLGLAPFVRRALAEAEADGAAAVVFEIETFGGRVDAAVQIRDALLDSKLRTVAFVNKRAISAGALIALSAQTVVMASGGTIGAAAPVVGGAPGAESRPADEKTVSYVRKEFRATAEARQRPLALAEAMVDADVVVPGVVEKGKLLTLTTEEAIRNKVADHRADTMDAVLAQLGLAGAELRTATPHWAESLVRFLTHPIVSSLLISAGMLGIFVELRAPGLGWPVRWAWPACRCSSGATGWCNWRAGKRCCWPAPDWHCWWPRSSSSPASASPACWASRPCWGRWCWA
jgi:membrane-bound ClpP family serine protease